MICDPYEEDVSSDEPLPKKSKKYRFEPILREYEPIDKQLKWNRKLLPSFSFENDKALQVFEHATIIDTAWIFTHYFFNDSTPLWVGFNSNICKNKLPKDRVKYLISIE